MSSKSIAEMLIEIGVEEEQTERTEKMDATSKVVGRIFAAVDQGKLPLSVLDNLAKWAENPTQEPGSSDNGHRPKALGSSPSATERFDGIAQSDPNVATAILEMIEGLMRQPESQRNARALGARKVIDGETPVNTSGEPEEVQRLRQQVKGVEQERDDKNRLLNELTQHVGTVGQKVLGRRLAANEDVKDYLKEVENKAGSPGTPAGGLDKTKTDKVKADIKTVRDTFGHAHPARMGNNMVLSNDDYDKVNKALEDVEKAVS